MFLVNYFEMAKTKQGFKSEAELGRAIGLSAVEMQNAKRRGHIRLPALKLLAELAGVPVDEVYSAQMADKAEGNGEVHGILIKAYQKVKQASAVLGIGAVLIGGSVSNDAHANAAQHIDIAGKTAIHVIKITGNWIKMQHQRFLRFFTGFQPSASFA